MTYDDGAAVIYDTEETLALCSPYTTAMYEVWFKENAHLMADPVIPADDDVPF